MLCARTKTNTAEPHWTWRKLESCHLHRVVSLANEGLTPIEIAEHLDIHKSNVSRHLKKARAQGLVEGKSHEPEANCRRKMDKLRVARLYARNTQLSGKTRNTWRNHCATDDALKP